MPYVAQSNVSVGDPVTATFINMTIGNVADHESRLVAVEGAVGLIEIFNGLIINASSFSTLTGLAMHRANQAFTLTGAKIGFFTKGSLTGTLEIDIKKSTSLDFGSAVSVFSTKPSINFVSASNYTESSNAAFHITNKVVALNDWLKFDITSMPTNGTLGKFTIVLYGEV